MTVKQAGGKKFTVEIRDHRVDTDMHREDGGADGGMSPVEMLVASLAACVGMTIHTYCVTCGLPSEGISIDAVPTMADDPKRVGNVAMDVTLPEGFPADRREAVLRFVKNCPVHNTLTHPPELDLDIVSFSGDKPASGAAQP